LPGQTELDQLSMPIFTWRLSRLRRIRCRAASPAPSSPSPSHRHPGGFFRSASSRPARAPVRAAPRAQGVVQILLNRDKRQVKIGIDKLIELVWPGNQPIRQPATPE